MYLALRTSNILTLLGITVNIANPQATPQITASCGHVVVFGKQPISAQPENIQTAIRAVVSPDIRAVMKDTGMGVIVTSVNRVPLNVVKIRRAGNEGSLFIVSWDDRSFGVNGAIWIVETTPHGARSINPSPTSQQVFSLGGFGVANLSPASEHDPELMFASKGFKAGGGSESNETCVRRVGATYQQVSCPATCHQELNAR